MHIETVTVELLRAGPRHNQLVSPLTQYLAVCGSSPAGRVSLPYEHGELERLLQELRYRVEDPDDARRAGKVLDQLGADVATLLSAVPGLPGALDAGGAGESTLKHLRVVMSASELALLPFEASKLPVGEGAGSSWLAQRPRAPVCITRHIRSAAQRASPWPKRPRILFVSGPRTPHDEHEAVLKAAVAPYRDKRPGEQVLDPWLTVCRDASVDDICCLVAQAARDKDGPFTHVHVLAHGTPLDLDDRYSPVGIELKGAVVSGKQLATALCTGDGHYPSVVTLATCDSGAVLDVRTTDASIAHDLHDQGITLVVASQYPLTVEGSVPLVDQLYPQLLRGEHPLVALYRVRGRLHSLMAHRNHDWASVVVYEALPPDIDARLEDLRYWQARRAQANALQRLEQLVKAAQAGRPTQADDWQQRLTQADVAADALPTVGPYVLECEGLRAAADKRVALALLNGAVAGAPIDDLKPTARERLQRARLVYWRATQGFLGSWQEPGRKKANLHWLLGQVLALDAFWKPTLDAGQLALARMAAETDLQAPDFGDRGWAHISLAEQALLQLGVPQSDDDAKPRLATTCLDHLQQMVDLCGLGSEQVMSTARQLRRYVNDFGAADRQHKLQAILGHFPDHWQGQGGLVETAVAALRLMGQPPTEPDTEPPQDPSPAPGPAPVPGGDGNARLATTAHGRPRRADSHLTLEMLSAANGDCLWLEYGDPQCPRRVLIDCGAKATAAQLAPRIAALPQVTGRRPFDLFVLTHVDADHINGALPLFDQPGASGWFDDVWFNGTPQMQRFLSVQQGEAFSQRLARPDDPFPWNRAVTPDGTDPPEPVAIRPQQPRQLSLPDGLTLTLLSPTDTELAKMSRKWFTALKDLEPVATLGRAASPLPDPATFDLSRCAAEPVHRDSSPANGSSIALLAEFDGHAVLLTGDAYAEVLSASIRALQAARGRSGKPLPLTALKLSHHGSAHGTTPELLELVDCHHYLVSTDGSIFQHPDLAALARVVLQGGRDPTLYFNHRNERTAFWADARLQQRYPFHTVLPAEGTAGLMVDLAQLGRSG